MLEHSQLLIQGWTRKPLPDGPAWVRRIVNAADRELGFVRLQEGMGASWFSWLRKIRLDVFETADASHLFTIRRSWGVLRMWEVDDAEECHVGTIYTRNIVSAEGTPLGILDRAGGERGRIVDPTKRLLARFTHAENDSFDLNFAGGPANPFLRMLILASVLTLTPLPKHS